MSEEHDLMAGLEPAAVRTAERFERPLCKSEVLREQALVAQISIAISLKRIADTLGGSVGLDIGARITAASDNVTNAIEALGAQQIRIINAFDPRPPLSAVRVADAELSVRTIAIAKRYFGDGVTLDTLDNSSDAELAQYGFMRRSIKEIREVCYNLRPAS